MEDVIIIGAGVVGASIARELAKQDRRILVLEKNWDVAEGASKANSGIVHGGHDALPGTLKAKYNILGSRKMEALSRELDFPYIRNGSLVLLPFGGDRERLKELLARGIRNGVEGLEIIEREQLRMLEPNVSESMEAALFVPSGAITDPFLLTIALAENAAANGVEFRFGEEVRAIQRSGGEGYCVETENSRFDTKLVVNAAGVYADRIHAMVSREPMEIIPVRGQYCLFDKEAGDLVRHTLFRLPTEKGKGILITPTVHGNLMAGPTAETLSDKEAVNTTAEGLSEVLEKGAGSIREMPQKKVITSFAGLRAHERNGDFIIGQPADAPGFIDAAGIESPGLTAAPAIGEAVSELVMQICPAPLRQGFIHTRKSIPCMALSSDAERKALIDADPAYANVICRCELVTEGEIREALRRVPRAETLDGIKRRVRAGMGRCQGGFCSPKVLNLIAQELGLDPQEITKCGGGSGILMGRNKEEGHG